MSSYLKIAPGGQLKLFKHNGDRQAEYRYKYGKDADGKFTIKNRKTKAITTFETEEEQDAFFYDEKEEIELVWVHLRDNVYLEPGVTLGDILKVIEDHDELKVLAISTCPSYPTVRDAHLTDEPAEIMVVTTQGVIQKGEFVFEHVLGFQNGRNWDHLTKVEISKNFPIYENGEKIADLIYEPSLFELLIALFGEEDAEPCHFSKQGLTPEDSVLGSLFRPLTVSDDLTLGDVFEFVEKNPLLKDFVSTYSWCREIDAFHKQAKEPIPADRKTDLWHLEINRACSIYGAEHDDWFNCDPCLHAVGPLDEEDKKIWGDNPPEHTTWAVDFSHMATLVNLPFKLDEDFIIQWLENYKLKETRSFHMKYRLIDFLDAIYWEISFHGGPAEVEEARTELNESVSKIKDGLEEGKKYTSVEEIMNELDEDEDEEENLNDKD